MSAPREIIRVMEGEGLIPEVLGLRARGLTPKMIAKALGITRGEADRLIRAAASKSAMDEARLVGCWVSRGWSRGLSWTGHTDWREAGLGDRLPGLLQVVVVREHRYHRVTACAYLVDAQCLGVKGVIGPRVLERGDLDAFVAQLFAVYDGPPVRAPLELARELVFGAEGYARCLGFQPHPGFEACRGHLGAWTGPSAIVFGHHGTPVFVQGPADDAASVLATLEQSVGPGNFRFVVVEQPGDAIEELLQRARGTRRLPSRGDVGARGSDQAPAPSLTQRPAIEIEIPTRTRAPADALRGNPSGPLSDSLLRVMEPYILWPPTPDEIDELEDELQFGATVWNATAQSTDPTRTASLLESVVQKFSTGDPHDDKALRAHITEIAERKRRLCPGDPRKIVRIEVVSRGTNVEVLATSAWYR